MTELSEARARAVEARDEARNHVEKFPISEGDAVRVARLADVIDALLAVRRPSTPTEENVPTVEEWTAAMDAERVRQIEHGYDDAHDQEHGARHLLNWAIDYARRGKSLAASTMIRSALHLSPTEEDVERAAEALSIAAEGKPLCDLRMSDRDEFMREARAVVAALSAVHPEVTQ